MIFTGNVTCSSISHIMLFIVKLWAQVSKPDQKKRTWRGKIINKQTVSLKKTKEMALISSKIKPRLSL